MKDIGDDRIEMSEEPEFKALTLDADLYQAYLDDTDLSDDQKREFIEAIWTIMVGFVDLGFKIEPKNSCGQVERDDPGGEIPPLALLKYDKDTMSAAFERASRIKQQPQESEEV